jgi:hypothetical protein
LISSKKKKTVKLDDELGTDCATPHIYIYASPFQFFLDNGKYLASAFFFKEKHPSKLIIVAHTEFKPITDSELKFKTVNKGPSMRCEELHGSRF